MLGLGAARPLLHPAPGPATAPSAALPGPRAPGVSGAAPVAAGALRGRGQGDGGGGGDGGGARAGAACFDRAG